MRIKPKFQFASFSEFIFGAVLILIGILAIFISWGSKEIIDIIIFGLGALFVGLGIKSLVRF